MLNRIRALQPVLVLPRDEPASPCPCLLQTNSFDDIVLSTLRFVSLFLMLNPTLPAYVLYISYSMSPDLKDIPTSETITGGPYLLTSYYKMRHQQCHIITTQTKFFFLKYA
jgi:hypothetical protein